MRATLASQARNGKTVQRGVFAHKCSDCSNDARGALDDWFKWLNAPGPLAYTWTRCARVLTSLRSRHGGSFEESFEHGTSYQMVELSLRTFLKSEISARTSAPFKSCLARNGGATHLLQPASLWRRSGLIRGTTPVISAPFCARTCPLVAISTISSSLVPSLSKIATSPVKSWQLQLVLSSLDMSAMDSNVIWIRAVYEEIAQVMVTPDERKLLQRWAKLQELQVRIQSSKVFKALTMIDISALSPCHFRARWRRSNC